MSLPTKPSEVLEAAADFYKKNGWAQGSLCEADIEWVGHIADAYGDYDEPPIVKKITYSYCAIGAMGAVVTNEELLKMYASENAIEDYDLLGAYGDGISDLSKGTDLVYEAALYLARAIEPDSFVPEEYDVEHIVTTFNDCRGGADSKGKLMRTMRKAARLAAAEGR